MDNKFFYNGEILNYTKLYKKSFISLLRENEKYIIKANINGLKSFKNTLELFSKKRNGFLFLDDADMNGYYCYHPDFFFDAPSIRLEIIKIVEECHDIVLHEYIYPINNNPGVRLYISSTNLKKMIKQIMLLIKNKKCSCIEFNVVTEDNSFKKLIIYKNNNNPLRKK